MRSEIQWKAVIGYEGSYEVSDRGDVRSLPKINRKGTRTLSPVTTPSGHRQVHLSNGKPEKKHVHRLVAEAFIPNPLGLPFVCHNNGRQSDNRVCNLRWDTPLGNQSDRKAHGTGNAGAKHGRTHLTDERFLADMGPRPNKSSLNRIGNALVYSKETCEWADRTKQARDRRCTRWVHLKCGTFTLKEAAEQFNLSIELIESRWYRGWRGEKLIGEKQ